MIFTTRKHLLSVKKDNINSKPAHIKSKINK